MIDIDRYSGKMLDIERAEAISTFNLGDIDNFELLTVKEELPLHVSRILEQKKYSPLGHIIERQVQTLKKKEERQGKA